MKEKTALDEPGLSTEKKNGEKNMTGAEPRAPSSSAETEHSLSEKVAVEERVRSGLMSLLFRVVMIALIGTFFVVMAMEAISVVEPYLYPLHLAQGKAHEVSANVIIGPYPREKEIANLKNRRNVVEIISLMNPDIPFERRLIEKERGAARKAGIKFSNRPMSYLPLKSDQNKAVADSIAALARAKYGPSEKKKLYVHCYLGRHRVSLVTKALDSLGAPARPKVPAPQ